MSYQAMTRFIFVTALVFAVTARVRAEIFYDPATDGLRVYDYPKDIPCDLKRLAAVDAVCGWNKVQYDKATGAYTINCDLWIGANNGTETYFQIGSSEHPKETLTMNGNLYIGPHWVKMENKGAYWWYVSPHINRLTIGNENNKSVRPTIRFASGKTLYSGFIVRNGKASCDDVRGGQLFVYNGTITAAKDYFGAPGQGGLFLYGDGNVLVGAEISRVKGNTCYGADAGWKKEYKIESTVFDDFGFIAPGKQEFGNCVFRGAREYAIGDWGSIDAKFVNCRFENNNVNFLLQYSDKGVTCVDCDIFPGNNPDVIHPYRVNGKTNYPTLTIQNHVVVDVIGADGKPVGGATVTVNVEQPGSELQENTAITGADGKTPKDALPLTLRVVKATNNPVKPDATSFTYAIVAGKNEKKTAVEHVVPDLKGKIVTLKLN